LHLVGILFQHINEDARSKSHQIYYNVHTDPLSLFFSHCERPSSTLVSNNCQNYLMECITLRLDNTNEVEQW